MKKYTLLLLVMLSPLAMMAQSNEPEARKKYLQAESAFLNQKYAEALNLVDESKTLLGRNSPKIQLLKVLIYEKLVLENIGHYDLAIRATEAYLSMQNEMPPLHQSYVPLVRDIQKNLSARKRAVEEAQWVAKAEAPRVGVFVAMPGKHAIGMDYGITLGKRSRFWVIGSSVHAGKYLEDAFYQTVTGKLLERRSIEKIRRSFLHVGYFQGIRVLPKDKDFIRPYLGARVIYGGKFMLAYKSRTEGQPDPDQTTIDNINQYGLDPGSFFLTVTEFHDDVSLDAFVGVMSHYKNVTFSAGKELMNSRMFQLAISFSVD
jgi:hypothetical protein